MDKSNGVYATESKSKHRVVQTDSGILTEIAKKPSWRSEKRFRLRDLSPAGSTLVQ